MKARCRSSPSAPNAHTLLTVSNQHLVRLWDTSTGKAIGQPLTHPDELSHVDFSPDGEFVETITEESDGPFLGCRNGAAARIAACRPLPATGASAQTADFHLAGCGIPAGRDAWQGRVLGSIPLLGAAAACPREQRTGRVLDRRC